MRESDEIDYGILGPDIILQSSTVYTHLGSSYMISGCNEKAIDALLYAWDRRKRHDAGQVSRLKAAFLVPLRPY